jgi:hypothetical protein
MFREHFIHLFKYNDWATKRSAESIGNMAANVCGSNAALLRTTDDERRQTENTNT